MANENDFYNTFLQYVLKIHDEIYNTTNNILWPPRHPHEAGKLTTTKTHTQDNSYNGIDGKLIA